MNLRTRLLGAAFSAALLASPAAAATPVFSWDFEAAPTLGAGVGYSLTAGGGSIDGSEALPGFGTQYFHNATSNPSYLTLTGLGAHNRLNLSFDIAFIDTWDGNDSAICCNPDYLFVKQDGHPLLTLSSNNQQGVAPQYQGGVVTADGNYAVAADFRDIIVHYDLSFYHTGSSLNLGLRAGGAGWQGDGNPFDESYGVDNISLSSTAVPEPAAWAMMLLGFGGLGALIRRRRGVVV